VTESVFARLTTRTADQLRKARQRGVQIKLEEESASKARSAEIWARESRRREERARAKALRQRQERFIVALTIGLVIVTIVVAVIVAAIAGQSPVLPS
jgi:hypothetical protein